MFTGILHFLSNQTEEEEKRTRWKNQILLLTHSKKKKSKNKHTHTELQLVIFIFILFPAFSSNQRERRLSTEHSHAGKNVQDRKIILLMFFLDFLGNQT
jgi:hypothetical protein